jgi:hypothetical protein
MSKGKRYKAIRRDANLTPEQQEALAKWQKDFQRAHPLIVETQAVAQRLWKELLDADEWRIAVSEVPEHLKAQQEKPEVWSVGHAKVNYVEKIEVKGDSE